ncbi:MAG: signal peptide peptidase SppA [Bacteroidaceae bacterium]
MKDFLKFTFATVVGIILTGSLFLIVGLIGLAGLISAADTEVKVKEHSVLFMDMNGTLEERSQDNPLAGYMGETMKSYGLDDVLTAIRKAKETDEVEGIYLQGTAMQASYASLEEIRAALLDFRSSGKFIVAYGDLYAQNMYYLASVADKVILNPQGTLDWKGLVLQPMFFKDLLDKLGVEMQIFKVGTYKSAVEPYVNTEMSEANREQVTAFLASIWERVTADVSASRGISVDSLQALADLPLTFCPAEDLVACGMVDTLLYKDGVRNYLKQRLGMDDDDEIRTVSVREMARVKRHEPKDKSGKVLAVYYAYGEIDGMGTDEGIVSDKVVRDLRRLREDEDVKAVVLRVNSPGGSAFGSEQIWNEVRLLKAQKPVVVSMGDYAASGGYYILCEADSIVAEPTTLTGSIGIFGMVPNVTGLTDRLGLDFDVVKTNAHADFGAMGRGMSSDEKMIMQQYINRGYELFVKRCADGRNMSTEAIKRVAEGRVWTGVMAKELGLVDELGGLDKAIEIAAGKAGLEHYTRMDYPEKTDFLSSLLDQKVDGYIQSRLQECFGGYYRGFNLIRSLEAQDHVQARMPIDFEIR